MGCKGSSVRITPSRPKFPRKSSYLTVTGFFLSGPRVAVWGLLGGLFSTRLPPQYRQCRSPRIRRRYLVGLIDQLAQFGRRVVAGDAAVLVTQQDLPVFLRHACGAKPATERVLQVMHADRRKTRRCRSLEALLVHRGRPFPCLAPRRVVHAVHRSGIAILVGLTVGKHPYRIQWLSFAPRLIKRPSGRSLELVDATGIAEKHPVSRVWDHSSSTKGVAGDVGRYVRCTDGCSPDCSPHLPGPSLPNGYKRELACRSAGDRDS